MTCLMINKCLKRQVKNLEIINSKLTPPWPKTHSAKHLSILPWNPERKYDYDEVNLKFCFLLNFLDKLYIEKVRSHQHIDLFLTKNQLRNILNNYVFNKISLLRGREWNRNSPKAFWHKLLYKFLDCSWIFP